MLLDGHLQSVLAMDFSPNGHHVATGGNDNAIRMWDLRKQACVYVIPAHTNLVSHVKFEGVCVCACACVCAHACIHVFLCTSVRT